MCNSATLERLPCCRLLCCICEGHHNFLVKFMTFWFAKIGSGLRFSIWTSNWMLINQMKTGKIVRTVDLPAIYMTQRLIPANHINIVYQYLLNRASFINSSYNHHYILSNICISNILNYINWALLAKSIFFSGNSFIQINQSSYSIKDDVTFNISATK